MIHYNEIPIRKINKDGKSKWQFYNIESDSVFGDTFKSYNRILKEIRKGGDTNDLWNFEYSPKNKEDDLGLVHWEGWSTNTSGGVYYDGKFILNIPNLFETLWLHIERQIKGYKIFKSDSNVSKVLAHFYSEETKIINGRKEIVITNELFTLFYIDDTGKLFVKNKQFKFKDDADVPFLTIDEEGKNQWQFYNRKKDRFHNVYYDDHYDIHHKITRYPAGDSWLWRTCYPTGSQMKSVELTEWNDWYCNDDGELFYKGELILSVFDYNFKVDLAGKFSYRIVKSKKDISKFIGYCQDCDEDGFGSEWYQTLFYINADGTVYFENNQPASI